MSSILVIVKLAERCNLDCPYCFMYYGPDQSWRNRPRFLDETLQDQLLERCVEHLDAFPEARVTLELHGGEPLLLGLKRMSAFLDAVRARLPPARTRLLIQTNGTLLDDPWMDLFEAQGVDFGISCDGPAEVHDAMRRDHARRPSHAAVERALTRAVARRRDGQSRRFTGVLAVVNPAFSGAEVVRYFHALGVPSFDLLLPDANQIHPPFFAPALSNADLLRFLVDAFYAWTALDDPAFEIRIFVELIRGLLGRPSSVDAFGADTSSLLVVETDGSYQLVDVMHICSEEAAKTPLSLQKHSFSAFMDHVSADLPALCATCLACPVLHACGGGYLPHRFDGSSFDNPSYYCDVFLPLIRTIYTYLREVTPREMWAPREPDALPA